MKKNQKQNAPLTAPSARRAYSPAWLFLFAAVFLLYLPVSVRVEDDVWFATEFFSQWNGDLFGFLNFRLHTWSTRLLLEALMMPLLRWGFLYKLSIAGWYLAIGVAAAELLELRDDRSKWAVAVSLLLVPMALNTRAGYVCTTINYVFTVACFLWAILPIVRRESGQKIPWWADVRSVVLMLLACNMEYYTIPALLLALGLLVRGLRRRRFDLRAAGIALIALLSGIYAANAPFSTVEAYATSGDAGHFPGFELLGAGGKLAVGVNSTAGGLISTYRFGDQFFLGTLVACALLALALWSTCTGDRPGKRRFTRVVGCVPLAVTAVIGFGVRLSPAGSAFRELFYVQDSGWACPTADGSSGDWRVTLVVALVFFAALLTALWRLRPGLSIFGIAAVLNRITMGATRAVYASGLRTFYPLLFLLCITAAVCCLRTEGRLKKPAQLLLLSGAALSVLSNLLLIF